MQIKNIDFSRAAIINSWKNDPFYGEEAVVLGLDIGIEGIGIAVRKGKELVYCKSLMVSLPGPKPLAGRRTNRGARRARKNRRLRMRRLKILFEEHGLPWVNDDVMSRSDPFPMRYRAAYKGGLASKEALSICIRSLVAHRGYDFYALSSGEGGYPWGEEPTLKDACKWLSSSFVDDEAAEELYSYTEELMGSKGPLNDDERKVWEKAIDDQKIWSEKNSMEKMLKEYASNKSDHRRGRGINFPRSQVEAHLRDIIQRHASLVSSTDEFMAKLFLPCTTPDQKAASIFHYNRKTPDECREHFEKKIGKCPFALHWGLEENQCALRSTPDVRKWNLLDFLSNRRFILLEGKQQVSRTLPENCVKTLIDYLVAHTTSKTKPSWDKAKKALETVLKAENLKIAPQEKVKKISPWDKLKERIAPGRSSKQSSPEDLRDFLSHQNFPLEENGQITEKNLSENCVKTLIEYLAAHPIPDATPSWKEAKEALKKVLKAEKLKIASKGKTQKNNVWDQLKDLIAPSRSLKNRAKLSSEAARQLFNDATRDGTSFDPKKISARKKEIGYYEVMANTLMDYGVYTQVQTLLGVLRKPKEGKAISSPFGVKGFLHQLFEKELKDKLGGKSVPDYCIIECIKDPPRNEEEKKKRADASSDSRAFVESLAKMYGFPEVPGRSVLTRLKLYRQQGGMAKDGIVTQEAICPFTGRSLGPKPLAADLQLAHLFPDSRGGLAIEDNLVLTRSKTNSDMDNLTPREAADRNSSLGWLSWEKMLAQSKAFKWSDKKRELFSFVPTKELPVPDFENLTRTAQLARQLRRMVCVWMGLTEDSGEIRKRIGNPSGLHTSAARKGWKVGKKDRNDVTHHRVDAAILSFIPPGAGVNDIHCGGIFENKKEVRQIGGKCIDVYVIRAVEGLKPDLSSLDGEVQRECPVVSLRSRSKSKPLGDGTFWSVDPEGNVWQRVSLLPSKQDDLKKFTVENLKEKLFAGGISENRIPSDNTLEAWLENPQKALHLKNGKPVRFFKKKSGKGTFKSPLGWSGIIHPDGRVAQLRKLKEANDRLELWLGWNSKGKRWDYYKRIIPTNDAMRGLRRLGIPWRSRKNLPKYMVDLLNAENAVNLRQSHCGKLPPFAHKVGEFKKGDVFLIPPKKGEKAKEGVDTTHFTSEESILPQSKWCKVSAIKTEGCIELKPLLSKEEPKPRKNRFELAAFLGLGLPEELARKLKLRSPSVEKP
ncbi:MAG: hypothetical protein M0Q48_09450 [Verrucomicrobia bacterium]|nr:hypothetical protein [Verrucomicrobiota bacterium]